MGKGMGSRSVHTAPQSFSPEKGPCRVYRNVAGTWACAKYQNYLHQYTAAIVWVPAHAPFRPGSDVVGLYEPNTVRCSSPANQFTRNALTATASKSRFISAARVRTYGSVSIACGLTGSSMTSNPPSATLAQPISGSG
jgi:hypothetical protein